MVTLETIEALIKEKFETNEKSHNQINDHLKKLNGQVAANTSFRNKAIGGFAVILFLGVTIIVKIFS